MASVVISGRGGQLGGATSQTYYCFDCDRTSTIIATSDSGLTCSICGHVVLEEFETPPSSPLSPPSPPPRSTAVVDHLSFFPTSDTDSDIELSDPLPPPPPPPFPLFITSATTSTARETVPSDTVDFLSHFQIHPPPPPPPSRSSWDIFFPLDTEARHLRSGSPPPPPPPPLPSVSVISRRHPCPQFPVSSAPTIDNSSLSPPQENDTTQNGHFESEPDTVQPPLPPSPPREPENLNWDYFFPPLPSEVNIPDHLLPSELLPPPPRTTYDHLLPSELLPPPPPPWLQPRPMEGLLDTKMTENLEGLLDMKMTENLVSEWESHQCSICIDNFELNQKVKLTSCNHLYHSDCLLRWLDLHKSCPVCRCKFPSQ